MLGKKNRLLALLLSASMILSAGAPVWAEEEPAPAAQPPAEVQITETAAPVPSDAGQSAPVQQPEAVQEAQPAPGAENVPESNAGIAETPAADKTGEAQENEGIIEETEENPGENDPKTASAGSEGKKTSSQGKSAAGRQTVSGISLLQIVNGAESALSDGQVLSIDMKSGDTLQLKAVAEPEDAAVISMQWTSSDTGVAVVTAIGGHMALVKPVAPGQTVVTVSVAGSSCTAQAVIRVAGGEPEDKASDTGKKPAKSTGKAAASGGEAAQKNPAGQPDAAKNADEKQDSKVPDVKESILNADLEESAVENMLLIAGAADTEAETEEEDIPEDGMAEDTSEAEIPEGEDAEEETAADAANAAADTVVSADDYSFKYSGGTGKTTITIGQLVKRGEQYYATICFSSKSYTKMKAGGTEVDSTITDHSEAELPVEINTPYVISGYTVAMSEPHWIDYTITITYEEPEEEPASGGDEKPSGSSNSAATTVTGTSGMYTPVSAVVTKQEDGSYVARITMKNAVPQYACLGTADEGLAHSVAWYKNEGDSTASVFTVPVSALGTEIPMAFSKDGSKWTNSVLTFSADTTETDEADASIKDENIDPAKDPEPEQPEEKTGNLTNLGSEGMFKIVSASLEGTGGSRMLRIALNATGYEYLYKGTTEEAAGSKVSERIAYTVNAAGKYEFLIPVSASDTTFEVAALSKSKNAWYKRTITLDQNAMTISSDATSGEEPIPDNPADEEPEEPEQPVESGKLEVSSTGMFKVVSAALEESGSAKQIRFALNGTGYEYLYKGSTAEAAVSKVSERAKFTQNGDGKYEFVLPVSGSGTFEVAALSKAKGEWYRRVFTLDLDKMTLVTEAPSDPNPVPDNPAAETEPEKDNSQKDNTGKDTKKDDGAATGATGGGQTVGGYTFRWSGGSGKVVISCTSVTERDGKAYATIVFSGVGGRSSHYDAVQVGGATYSGANVFTIPVNLNANTTISARTTAMSQAHWITYSIYVGKAGGDGSTAEKSTLHEETEKLDEKAPDIAGLSFAKEIDTAGSDLLKIYQYKDTEEAVYALIEVDLKTRTPRENAKAGESRTDAAPEDADDEQSAEEKEAAAAAELMKQLYDNNVVKYLVIPEGTEVPAGLDKEVIIIHQPVEHASVGSQEALGRIEEMELLDRVAVVNMNEADVSSEAVKALLADGSIVCSGSAEDPEYRDLIRQKADLLILPSSIFAEAENLDAVMETYRHIASRAITLGIPVLIDRSADEKTEAAAATWYLYYGEIFGAQDKAQELYVSAVK